MSSLVASCFVSYVSGSTLSSLFDALTESVTRIKLPDKSTVLYYELYPIDDEVLLNIHYTVEDVSEASPAMTPFIMDCRKKMYKKLHAEFSKGEDDAL